MKRENVNKRNNILLLISIIFVLTALFALLLRGVLINKDNSEPIIYNELISTKKDTNNKRVKIIINDIPYKFATVVSNEANADLYIAFDQNYYMYITKLSEETYKTIEDLYYNDIDNFSYELIGYTSVTSEDIKSFAIEAYNNWFKGDSITDNNFDDYFGKTYLDITKKPYDLVIDILKIISITFMVISFVYFILYLKPYKQKEKKNKKKRSKK